MGVDYGSEKFFSVIHYAIASTDSLQNRLAGVISGVAHLQRDSFPDEQTWNRFHRLLEDTTRLPAKSDEGTINATTSQMSQEEVRTCLQEALSIFSDLEQAYGKEQASRKIA